VGAGDGPLADPEERLAFGAESTAAPSPVSSAETSITVLMPSGASVFSEKSIARATWLTPI
jgi:hypothetical protein